MAIMNLRPSAPPSVQPRSPVIESKAANSVIVDNNVIQSDSLITHISGIAYIVDYYRLVINKDNALYSQDVGQSGVQQQYTKYKNFELRQQGSLSDDQDDIDKIFVVRGTAIVHSGLIPNEGDMFAADVGDGRLGVFNITRSQRLSILKDSTYQVEYALAYFTSNKPEDFADLETKVIETFYYIKDRLDYNDGPFLSTEEYNFNRKLGQYYKEICDSYFSLFFSKEYAAYILPGQLSSTFDYFLYKTLRVLFKDEYSKQLSKHQAINIQDDDLIERKLDLFSILLERSASKFDICDRRVGTTRTATFSYEGTTTNIRYTGIRSLIYPISNEERTDVFNNTVSHPVLEGILVPTPNTTDAQVLSKETMGFTIGDKIVPLIKLVTIDDYYVLSEDFYKRTDNLSILEEQVLNYIDSKPCNTTAIKLLCENYKYWPRLERFYYMPLILILIQSLLKDI